MARTQHSVLREGVVAGLIGAAVVAVWFFAYDTARGTPFLTPALLGTGIVFSLVMGFFGGLFPAARAAFTKITSALRQVG